jgi:hypothetical protein
LEGSERTVSVTTRSFLALDEEGERVLLAGSHTKLHSDSRSYLQCCQVSSVPTRHSTGRNVSVLVTCFLVHSSDLIMPWLVGYKILDDSATEVAMVVGQDGLRFFADLAADVWVRSERLTLER